MKKIRHKAFCLALAGTTFVLTLAIAQNAIKAKFPKPIAKTTPTTFIADMNANIPIVILVNRTGGTLTDYTQLNIEKPDSGIWSHGKGNLANGQQRIIAPYIRSGGTVRMVYQINGRTYPSWNSKGSLQPGVPMVLTFYPKGEVTVNKPYSRR